jgi:transposase
LLSRTLLILIFLFTSALPPTAFGCCCAGRVQEEEAQSRCPKCASSDQDAEAAQASRVARRSCCQLKSAVQTTDGDSCGNRCLCRNVEHDPAQRPKGVFFVAQTALATDVFSNSDDVISRPQPVQRPAIICQIRSHGQLCVWRI